MCKRHESREQRVKMNHCMKGESPKLPSKSGEIPDLIWLQLMISFLECNLICFATDDLVASIHLPDAVIIAVLHP